MIFVPYRSAALLFFIFLAACSAMGDLSPTPAAVESEPTNESTSGEMVSESNMKGLPAGFDAQGHRGARGLKPESTLPAFETALDLGVTTLEFDLHYTADQLVVVWHDPAIDKALCGLDPTSDVETHDPDSLVNWGSGLMISQLTLEQVQAYRCDRNPDPEKFPDQENGPTTMAGDNFGIVTLTELFDFVAEYGQSDLKSPAQRENARQVRFNMETKRKVDRPKNINDDFDGVNPGQFELEIMRIIDAYGLQDRIIIQSFDHRSLWAIRSVNEDISLAALTRGVVPDLPAYAKQGANIWSPYYGDASPALISKAHESGLQVIPWTINNATGMRDLIDKGVDGIITDRPDILLNLNLEGE